MLYLKKLLELQFGGPATFTRAEVQVRSSQDMATNLCDELVFRHRRLGIRVGRQGMRCSI